MGRWLLALLACLALVGCRDYPGQKSATDLQRAYRLTALGQARSDVVKMLGKPARESESKELEDIYYLARDPKNLTMLKVSFRREEVVDVTLFYDDYRESKALGRIEN